MAQLGPQLGPMLGLQNRIFECSKIKLGGTLRVTKFLTIFGAMLGVENQHKSGNLRFQDGSWSRSQHRPQKGAQNDPKIDKKMIILRVAKVNFE